MDGDNYGDQGGRGTAGRQGLVVQESGRIGRKKVGEPGGKS